MAEDVTAAEIAAQVPPEDNTVPPVTRPARKRTPSSAKSAPAPKAAPVAAPVQAAPATAPDDGLVRTPMVLIDAGNTKNYAKFVPPAGSGVTGALYAPLGTAQIRVLLLTPNE